MTTDTPARYTLKDADDFLSDVRSFRGKKAKADHIETHYPHLSRAFIEKNLRFIISMSAEQLVTTLGYPDPTGEHATNLAMRQAA